MNRNLLILGLLAITPTVSTAAPAGSMAELMSFSSPGVESRKATPAAQSNAHTVQPKEPISPNVSLNASIRSQFGNKEIKRGPIKIADHGLYVTELNDGRFILSTGDGRLFIKNAEVASFISLSDMSNDELIGGTRVDLSSMGIEPEGLHGPIIGTGDQIITVIIDPLCPNCHAFINDFQKVDIPGYKFKIVPANLISPDPSRQVAHKILSLPPEQWLAALSGDVSQFNNTKATAEGLEMEQLNRNVFIASQSKYVPLFIAPNGVIHESYPGVAALQTWIAGVSK